MDSTTTLASQIAEGAIMNGMGVVDPGAAPVAVDPENNANAAAEPPAAQEEPAAAAKPAKSYDDLFPSLPASAPAANAGSAPIGEWNRKPMFASSTITQVNKLYATLLTHRY